MNYDLQITAEAGSTIVPASGEVQWTLTRRYREFHALHQALISRRQHHNGVPALPPKKILFISGDSVQELANDRQKALQSCVAPNITTAFPLYSHSYCSGLATIPLMYTHP